MNPFFSIIIPTYNRAPLLKKAIESVLVQTFFDWELIIVDDGSTDNTKEVVQTYLDKRIKYIFQKNAERSAARNNGIENSSGTYICFLDSDDYYLADRLKWIYKELELQNFPIACFYTGALYDKGESILKSDENSLDKNIFDYIALSVIHSQQTCTHQSILQEFRYDTHFHIGEDMELWLRIADRFPFIYLKEQFTIGVVDHDDRSVNVKRYNSYVDQLSMFRYIFRKEHSGHKISTSLKKQLLGNAYFGIAKYHFHNKSMLKANYYLLRSILSNPLGVQVKYRLNILLNTIPFIGNRNKMMNLVENKL